MAEPGRGTGRSAERVARNAPTRVDLTDGRGGARARMRLAIERLEPVPHGLLHATVVPYDVQKRCGVSVANGVSETTNGACKCANFRQIA